MAKQIKKLDNVDLRKLQTLEKKLGYCVVALEKQPSIATLSETQLEELRTMETEMGTILVAYDCSPVTAPAL